MEVHSDHFFSRLKNFFKHYPTFYYGLAHFFGAIPLNKSALRFVQQIPVGKVIVSVGAGPQILRADVINTDITAYPGVSVVAPAENLPFEAESVDAVICDNLLEHVTSPEAVLREVQRILKPGGQIYVGVPFMIGFHSSPNDYYRWTHEGLREMLKHFFTEQELNIQYGPTAGAMYILYNWLALVLSFNLQWLYEFWLVVFMILLAPVKLLDLVVGKFSFAKGIALGFYYIGHKK